MSNIQLATSAMVHGGQAPVSTDKKEEAELRVADGQIEHLEQIDVVHFGHEGGKTTSDRAARAGIEQIHIIPSTGREGVTTRWEKWMFMIFREPKWMRNVGSD